MKDAQTRLHPRKKVPFPDAECGDTLILLSSEGLEEQTGESGGAASQPCLVLDSVHRENRSCTWAERERDSFVHVQNSTYSLNLNEGMAGSKLMIKTCIIN